MTPRERILAILNRQPAARHVVGRWLRTGQAFLLGFTALALNSLPGATIVPAANLAR